MNVSYRYSIYKGSEITKDTLIESTDEIIIDSVLVPYGSSGYSSSLRLTAEKEGYLSVTRSFNITTRSRQIVSKIESVKMSSTEDYFSKEFLSDNNNGSLKEKISEFVHYINLKGLISGAGLQERSIDIGNFKNKSYLGFQFNSSSEYNLLKLNKYQIGSILFDEVVRKILNPLNNYISPESSFYGYRITAKGYARSFAKENSVVESIDYVFYLSKSIVRDYKNKDISGQNLIDKSIILMDDERIDLKLQ